MAASDVICTSQSIGYLIVAIVTAPFAILYASGHVFSDVNVNESIDWMRHRHVVSNILKQSNGSSKALNLEKHRKELITLTNVTLSDDAKIVNDVINKRSLSNAAIDYKEVNMTSADTGITSPVTFMTSSAYLVTKLRVYSTFSIQFKFKTTKTDGLIFYGGSISDNLGDFLSIELDSGHVRYAFDVGSGTRVMTDRLPFPVADNSWHSVSVTRPSVRRHVFIVDGVSSVDILPDSRSVHFDLPNDDLFIGGADHRLFDLQQHKRKLIVTGAAIQQQSFPPTHVGRVKSIDGFQGCLASVELNGDRWSLQEGRVLINDNLVEHIVEGCQGPNGECSVVTCLNGAHCVQQWNTAVCDCDMTSFTGPTCDDDGVAYLFGRKGAGVISVTLSGDESLDTQTDRVVLGLVTSHILNAYSLLVRMASSASNDFIDIALVDGLVTAVYNMGKTTHKLIEPDHRVNDGSYHVIRFMRHGPNSSIQIDDFEVHQRIPEGRQLSSTFNRFSSVLIGGFKDAKGRLLRPFHGILAGVTVNGFSVLEKAADNDHRIVITGDVELTVTPLRIKTNSSHKPVVTSSAQSQDDYFLSRDSSDVIAVTSLPSGNVRHLSDLGDSTSDTGCLTGDCIVRPKNFEINYITPTSPWKPRHLRPNSSTNLSQRLYSSSGRRRTTAENNDLVASGRGPTGCRKNQHEHWNDDDDEDCAGIIDDNLSSSGDADADADTEGRHRDIDHTTQTRLKTLHMENVVIARGRVRDRIDVKDENNEVRHRASSAHNGRLKPTEAVVKGWSWPLSKTSTTSFYLRVLPTRTVVTWPGHTQSAIDRLVRPTADVPLPTAGVNRNDYHFSNRPLLTPSPTLSLSLVKTTVASPVQQQQQRSSYPSSISATHQPISSNSNLSLNIGLIIGIGSSVVILLLIAGYSVYRYQDGCLRGAQRGSYRLDTAASAGTEHHNSMHTGNRIPIPSSTSSCGPLGIGGLANGASVSPLGGALHMSRSKSNCKIPTKEWYV